MKREVLKIYLIITFFLFLLIIGYYLYKESSNDLGDDFVTFSKDSGFYDESISVKLSKNIDLPIGTVLYYTLDGNNPTIESNKYDGAIKLEMVPGETKVYPLKVIAYHDSKYSIIAQNTYVIDKDIKNNDIKIISVVSDEKNLYDYETGILVKGKTYDENAKNGITKFTRGNYHQRGEEWEKEARITMFDSTGNIKYDANSGIIVSGLASATLDTKSLKVIANKYDPNNKFVLNYRDIDSYSNNSLVTKYNSIKLRSGGEDMFSGNVRTSLSSRLAYQSGFDGFSQTERAIVFLNGNFYGIFDLQQNYSSSFISNKFNLDDNSLIYKVKGSETRLDDIFKNYLNTNDDEYLEKIFDMDNYLLYYAMEIIMNNIDWPTNNYEVWKYTGEYDGNNKYTDGRYRYILYDLDEIYYNDKSDVFVSLMENTGNASKSYFNKIIAKKYYFDKYIMLTQDLLNTSFDNENIIKIIDEEYAKLRRSYKKYYTDDVYKKASSRISTLKKRSERRAVELQTDFKKYFNLEKQHKVTVKSNEGIQVNFSNQELFQNKSYSNDYYVDIDLKYNYKEYPGYKFSYWLVNGKKIMDKELVIESEKYQNIDMIAIEAVAEYVKEDNHLLISEVYANGDSDWIKISNVGKESIELKGYFLTDRENKLYKYELPNIILKANESIIINGDKNYYSVGDYICNFSLKKGEKIFLSKNDEILDTFSIPKMSDIESFGRFDNSNTFKYFYNEHNERKKD